MFSRWEFQQIKINREFSFYILILFCCMSCFYPCLYVTRWYLPFKMLFEKKSTIHFFLSFAGFSSFSIVLILRIGCCTSWVLSNPVCFSEIHLSVCVCVDVNKIYLSYRKIFDDQPKRDTSLKCEFLMPSEVIFAWSKHDKKVLEIWLLISTMTGLWTQLQLI